MLERRVMVDILTGVMALAAVVVVAVFLYTPKAGPQGSSEVEETATGSQEPTRTEFGTGVPADFPADIPIEDGTQAEQSYSLNYAGQKQLTIVFASVKTVKENYALYADFLAKQGWNVSNKYESPKLSSLYGMKESNDINVTIGEQKSDASLKSQVSI